MPYYRLYYFDRFSGHIDHFREFDAKDDCDRPRACRRLGGRAPDGAVEPRAAAEAMGQGPLAGLIQPIEKLG